MAKVVSANRLTDGAVVFLGPRDRWVELLPEAEIFAGEAAISAALERAQAAETGNLVLECDAFEVTGSGATIAAAHLRDAIRAAGPTVHLDHGKQARPARRRLTGAIHVSLRRIRRRFRRRARRAVPRPGRAPARRRADRGPVQAAAADERPLSAAARLHAAHRHPLRHAVVAADAQARRDRAHATTAATAISPRARTCSSTGRRWRTFRTSWTSSPSVEMHAIQTSGNCIRNVTADHFAGAAADEIDDPRPYAEILRQWSSLHPEFTFLPRKFKIAVTGAPNDRAAIQVHDIGLQIVRNEAGEIGFAVYVGGGLGRTPMIGQQDPRLPAEARSARLLRGDPARLQSRRPARQQVQGAHQDPGAREGRRGVRARRSRRSSPRDRDGALRAAGRRDRPHRAPISRRPTCAPRRRSSAAVERAASAGRALRRASSRPTSAPTRCRAMPSSTISLKPIGGIPGDATRRADGRGRRSRRALRARRDPRHRTSRTSSCRMSRSTICRRVYDGLERARSRHRQCRARSPTSSPARASTIARWPPRARSRSRSAISERFGDRRAGARDRRAEDQDLRLHQRLRPSPCRPHRHPRRRAQGRRNLSDHARRLGRRDLRHRQHYRAGLLCRRRSSMRSRPSSTPISICAAARTRTFSPPTGASAWRPSRRRSISETPERAFERT